MPLQRLPHQERFDVEGFLSVSRGKETVYLSDEFDPQRRSTFADAVLKMTSAKQISSRGGWRGRSGKLSVVRARLDKMPVVVRRFTHGGALGGILPELTIGMRRALGEMNIVHIARERGVPTPRVVAALLRRSMGVFYRTYVITEEVEGATNMTEFFIRLTGMDDELAARYKKAAIQAVARAISTMHGAKILHGDLHLRNILVKLSSKPGRTPDAESFILDFDQARIVKQMTVGLRLKNLRRLMRSIWKVQPAREQFSLHDAVRFLQVYLGTSDRRVIAFWLKRLSLPPLRHRIWWFITGAGRGEEFLPDKEGGDGRIR